MRKRRGLPYESHDRLMRGRMKHNGNIYIFSRDNLELYVIRYIDRIGLVAIAGLYVWAIFWGAALVDIIGLLKVLPIILLALCLPAIVSRRFAYRVIVDLKKQQLTFYMFRKKDPVIEKISSLRRICLGFYITFLFDGRKILYNGVADKRLVDVLGTLMPITWRFWGRKIHKLL